MTNLQEPNKRASDGDIISSMMRVGLRDPFVQAIASVVAVATAASFAVRTFGDGKNTIIAVALALIFGVVLVIFRVLVVNVHNTIIRGLCIFSSVVLTGVFLIFIILTIPATTFCWPPVYAEFLALQSCNVQRTAAENPAFADLTDQLGNAVAIYPVRLFGNREKNADNVMYTWSERDRRTVMMVQTVPDNPGGNILKSEFDVLRKTHSKNHTYCLLKEKYFVVAFIDFDNRIRYTVGRKKNDQVTIIRINYQADLKREFDAFLAGDLRQYFIGDLFEMPSLQRVCADQS